MSKGTEDHMQFTKLTAVLPGVRTGTRSLDKLARLRTSGGGGQALLEFALCPPMLLLIVTGIMTFGIALNSYIELTGAVSIGARLLAVSRGQTTDPCATTATAVYNAAPFLTPTSNMKFTFVLNGTKYSGASCSSTSTTTGAAGNLVQGQPAQVTATYPCNVSVYGFNFAPTCTMTAQTTELVQ